MNEDPASTQTSQRSPTSVPPDSELSPLGGDPVPSPGNVRREMSPLRLLIFTTAAVVLAEVVAMNLTERPGTEQSGESFLFELLLMMVLVFPIIYLSTFRPLLRHIAERRRAEEALRLVNESLDSRVSKRTADLADANQTLRAEFAERMIAEQALEAERSFIAAILDTAGALVVVTDREGRIVRFNRSCEQATGYAFEEVRGRVFWDFLLPPEETPAVKAAFGQLAAGHFPLDHENCWVARDGTRRLITWANMTLLDRQGQVEHVIGTGIDVTERRRAEEVALRRAGEAIEARAEAERRAAEIETVLDAINDVVMVFDAAGRVVRVNPAAAAALGFDPVGLDLHALTGRVTVLGDEGRPFEVEEGATARALQGETVRWLREVVTSPATFESVMLVSSSPLHSAGQVAGAVSVWHDITERERAADALRVALEKYRVLFEAFPLGITISDASGQIVETNREATRLLSEPSEVMADRRIDGPQWRIIRPDGSPMPSEEYASVRALQEKRPVENVEMGIVKGHGDVTWINVTAAPIPLKGYGVAIAYSDITARKLAEEALRTSEENLSSLYASMTEGVALHEVVYDPDGQAVDYIIREVNPAFEAITGLPREQVVGRMASAAYGTAEPPYLDVYARVADSGEPTLFEVLYAPMGKHFSISAFSPEKGTFATVFEDITERRRAENELRETRDYLQKLFDYANAPIIVWDPEFRISRFNAAFERLTGLAVGDVLGRNLEILFPIDRREQAMGHIRRTTTGERWEVVEIPILHLDGSVRTVLWNSAALFGPNGTTVVATIAQGQDITLRKQAEEHVAASLREKEQLLKEIHHRVKNNLQIIASMLSLQAEQLSEERDLEALRQSQERIRSMAMVHEKLYRSADLSRIEFGEYIQDLAGHLLQAYRVGNGEISLCLVVEEVFLDIDTAIPLALIVNELITNSVKHAFPNGRGGEIAIELRRNDTVGFLLVVADNGVGMRGDLDFRTTESLGLQIVNILVTQLGGTIELDREAGVRFVIAFGEAT